MSLQRIALVAVAAALLVAVAPEAQGYGTASITSCGQTVTANAQLAHDLVCSGNGVVVGATGITIDLKGHTIRGNQSFNHYGVDDSGGYNKLTVKNGALRNFYDGVHADANKVNVSNVVATGNFDIGIFITGNNASVTSSTAAGNGFDGIDIAGQSATIKSSSTHGNAHNGIIVQGDDASIDSSAASGNLYGVAVGGNGASIDSTASTGNTQYGFQIAIFPGGPGVTITSSIASGNGLGGILSSGGNAKLEDNVADGNGFGAGGVSDLVGWGIIVTAFTKATGTNVALGNDDPAECSPANLC